MRKKSDPSQRDGMICSVQRELPEATSLSVPRCFVFCAADKITGRWVIRGSRLLHTRFGHAHEGANFGGFRVRSRAAPLQAAPRLLSSVLRYL